MMQRKDDKEKREGDEWDNIMFHVIKLSTEMSATQTPTEFW